MVLLIDSDIPRAADVFRDLGQLRLIPGHEIGPEDVVGTDALVVRSVTRVDSRLLGDAKIGFVGSATTGLDHVDEAWLKGRGIHLAHAAGANAESVVEYMLGALALASVRTGTPLTDLTLGIVGAGRIGSRLEIRTRALAMNTLVNDPLLDESRSDLVPLGHLLEQSDAITVHTPLTRTGPFPTFGLIGAQAINKMKPGAWFFNTARGGICDDDALVRARIHGKIGYLGLDVWADEPTLKPHLIRATDLATPHIAGYSVDAKRRGILMIRRALREWMGLPEETREGFQGEVVGRIALPDGSPSEPEWLDQITRHMMDLRGDDARFRSALMNPDSDLAGQDVTGPFPVDLDHRRGTFHALRADYPIRYSFERYVVQGPGLRTSTRTILESGLGVKVDENISS